MANQFDLEQGIMSCWNVTTDLDLLFEELVENQTFTKDQASNFVLGLKTIYEAKFDKLFRDFESFLKEYYELKRDLIRSKEELNNLENEIEEIEEANAMAAAALAEEAEEAEEGAEPVLESLDDLFNEEEANEETVEDEFAPR